MDKLKVLAICYEDPEVMIGGRGTYIKEIYRDMATREDVEIDLLTNGPEEKSKEYYGFKKHTSDKLICCKPRRPDLSANLFSDIQMLRKVMQWLSEGKAWDILHIHDWDTVQVGRAIRDSYNIPMIGSLHLSMTHFANESEGPYTDEIIYCMQQEGHLVVDTDRLTTCSKAYAKMLQELFMTKRHIDVVYNGIRTSEWYPGAGDSIRGKAKEHLSTKRPILLFVGRVADMKGIRPLLQAIELKDTGYQLVICGEVNSNTEKERDEWDVTRKIKYLENKYPERIRWIGFKTGQDLKDVYASADIGIMPSTHEPFGIVALEHMAMGIPLICTEVDGLKEVVNIGIGVENEFAFIIEPKAEQIIEALEELKDEEKRKYLKIMGLLRAKSFSWKTAADKTVVIYKEAIHDRFNNTNNSKESYTA